MKTLITKIKISHILTPLLAFLIPIKPLILIVGILIGIDTCTGIWKSKVNKIPISSRALSAVVSKFVLYQTAVILFYAIEYFIIGDFIQVFTSIPLFLTKIIAIILVGIEITSISENFKSATGVSLWERIKMFLRRAKNAKNELKEFENILPIDKLKKD